MRWTDPAALFLKAGDDHWNDAGQRYAAELLAEHILESAVLLPVMQQESSGVAEQPRQPSQQSLSVSTGGGSAVDQLLTVRVLSGIRLLKAGRG